MKNKIYTRKGYTKLVVFSSTYGRIETLIDKEDIEKVQKHIWRAVRQADKKNYRFSTGQNTEMILLHRYLVNCPDNMVVDHINRNTLDNRKNNLRICTQYENIANRKNTINKQSGQKYIYWNAQNKQWTIRIQKNNRQVYCGCRKSLKEAIILRDNCLKEVV